VKYLVQLALTDDYVHLAAQARVGQEFLDVEQADTDLRAGALTCPLVLVVALPVPFDTSAGTNAMVHKVHFRT